MKMKRQMMRQDLNSGSQTSRSPFVIPFKGEVTILRSLLAQPLSPISQLRGRLGFNPLTWSKYISHLQLSGFIRKYNAHYPELNGYWVLALTRKGLEYLAATEGLDLVAFLTQHFYQRGRLEWLRGPGVRQTAR
jgi:hypothetical protein